MENHENQIKDFKDNYNKKFKEATWLKPGQNKGHEMPPELKQTIEEQCPTNLPDVKAKLESYTDDLKRVKEVPLHEIKEVEALEKDKEKQNREIEVFTRTVNDLTKELKDQEDELVNGIQEMIESINHRFRELMDKMNFAGEVKLNKGEHELDFKNYGLEIFVKFHDKDKLQPLSSSVQSGGEKSVTTALYMMALQDMTQVPFRCVDEINQGMDERNEKAVWEILVDSANDHSAQFFYLAPKYPHGLQFEKNMHIHVCFNGNMDIRNESDNFIDVDAYIKKKQSS